MHYSNKRRVREKDRVVILHKDHAKRTGTVKRVHEQRGSNDITVKLDPTKEKPVASELVLDANYVIHADDANETDAKR